MKPVANGSVLSARTLVSGPLDFRYPGVLEGLFYDRCHYSEVRIPFFTYVVLDTSNITLSNALRPTLSVFYPAYLEMFFSLSLNGESESNPFFMNIVFPIYQSIQKHRQNRSQIVSPGYCLVNSDGIPLNLSPHSIRTHFDSKRPHVQRLTALLSR